MRIMEYGDQGQVVNIKKIGTELTEIEQVQSDVEVLKESNDQLTVIIGDILLGGGA